MNGAKTILLIEDDQAVARSLKEGLERDGFQVTWQENGAKGIAYARHPGQALSRGQIVEGVRDYEADVESERTVNVHIRRLREKIELDPSRPTLILTVPGIDYRLVN